jgi:hypothetical protein
MKWLLISLLGLVAALGPMVLGAEPVRAQSPYDVYQAQFEQIQQQLDELITLSNSSGGVWDASYASAIREALQQVNLSHPAADQAKMDEQCRQITGYTSTAQFFQSMSTLPDLASGLETLISGMKNLASGAETLPTAGSVIATTPPPTTEPVASSIPVATTNRPGTTSIVFPKGSEVYVRE